jgi:hypothetical protein
MVSKDAIIPIASLSAIVGVSLLFVLWWFPRTWNKGNAEERRILDEQIRQQRAWIAMQQQIQAQRERDRAVNRSGDGEDGEEKPPGVGDGVTPPPYAYMPMPPMPRAYRPPVAGLG